MGRDILSISTFSSSWIGTPLLDQTYAPDANRILSMKYFFNVDSDKFSLSQYDGSNYIINLVKLFKILCISWTDRILW